jgi:hypothetical protein
MKSCRFTIEKNKNSMDILSIDGISIHSRYAPEKEAEKVIAEGRCCFAIFGLGLAYHVNNISANNPHSIYIVFEPCNEIFEQRETWLSNPHNGNLLVLNTIDRETVYNFMEQHSMVGHGRIETWSNQGYRRLFPELESEFFSETAALFKMLVQDILTESHFFPRWTRNILYNLPSAIESGFFKPMVTASPRDIAVIAAAGPGLEKDITAIIKQRQRVTVLAVDTALKPLLRHGIEPDIICSLDAGWYSVDDFPSNIPDESLLVCDLIAAPPVARIHSNTRFTVTRSTGHIQVADWYSRDIADLPGPVATGGTVAHYALNIALMLGFTCIYFSGLDLSFPTLCSHTRGAPYHDRLLRLATYDSPAESQLATIISRRNCLYLPSRSSGTVLSDQVLVNYGAAFSDLVASSTDLTCCYDTSDGLLIDGFTTRSLDKLIDRSSKRIPSSRITGTSDKRLNTINSAYTIAQKRASQVYDLAARLQVLLENTDFGVEDKNVMIKWETVIDDMHKQIPFMFRFTIMTEMTLDRKGINRSHLLFYKHYGHKLLQSCYFVIRTLQRIVRMGEYREVNKGGMN